MSLVPIAIGILLVGAGLVAVLRPALLFKIRDPPGAPPGTPQREGAMLAYQIMGAFLIVVGLWLAVGL
ncbi:MAG: hypothetical protein ABEH65_11450 [Halobacteriales archaeon]